MDETLVHATDIPLARAPDFEVPPYALYLRPGVGEFLDWALSTFKVAVCFWRRRLEDADKSSSLGGFPER